MAENSHITWTDNTHNEWIGCTKVSAGCDNCYAEREQDHRYGRAKWGKGNARYLTSEANRRKPFAWERQAIKEGRRIKVFTASLSDVFDEEVPDDWRDALMRTIGSTPHLDWLVLTKRLAKMRRYLGAFPSLIPKNAWWGCSVEDQATANQRIPELLKLRALVGDAPLWLSIEPLLGSVDLDSHTWLYEAVPHKGRGIEWVVVGGESGPAARPMHPDWARTLRDQCIAAGVAFHFKQWGEWLPTDQNPQLCAHASQVEMRIDKHGDFNGITRERDNVEMNRVGKKTAGRLLDGREWNEFPREA